MSTENTLYVLLTCTLEETRFKVLQQVIQNLNEQNDPDNFDFKQDLIVFDNGSTFPDAVKLLKQNFNVWRSEQNVGFWSGLNWVFQNYQNLMNRDYKYVYVIESDMIHYKMQKLEDLEKWLNDDSSVGSVRCEEFEFATRHLYNKDRPQENSRRYAWCRFFNAIENQSVKFTPVNDATFKTNFVPKIPALNRLQVMKESFDELSAMTNFTEFDFQKAYYKRHQIVGLIDGGIFHCKPTNDDRSTMTASYTSKIEQEKVGYVDTRTGCTIIDPKQIRVQRVT